ncbi:triacylglycerol lipase [Cooperia oncophora]
MKSITSVTCDITLVDKCTGYSAVSTDDKAIILSFRGTNKNSQLIMESEETMQKNHTPWVAGGLVSKYFSDGFLKIWKNGMKDDLTTLQSQHSGYELWITGHSLGAAMASLAASYIAHNKLFAANKIKLVTFGQPRTGDKDYAASVEKEVPYTFRVTHAHDIIPHLPLENMEGYYHHKTEVSDKFHFEVFIYIIHLLDPQMSRALPVILFYWQAAFVCVKREMLVLVGLLLPLAMAMPFDVVSNSATQILYDDNFARSKMLPLAAAAYSNNPSLCLTNLGKDITLKRLLSVVCDITIVDKCTGFSAVSNDDKAIILSFRGTDRNTQLLVESDETMQKNHVGVRC